MIGTMNTELAALSINAQSPATGGDLVIREHNSLELLGDGLQTANGSVDIFLDGVDSTLLLSEGEIQAGGFGKPVTIVADDIDFHSGENLVYGTGDLSITSRSANRNYNLGSAAENYAGKDYTVFADNGALNLGMVDLAAIADDFSHVTIGHRAPGVLTRIGDAQDQTEVKFTKEDRVVNAALRNNTLVLGERINVLGADTACELEPVQVAEVELVLPELGAAVGGDAGGREERHGAVPGRGIGEVPVRRGGDADAAGDARGAVVAVAARGDVLPAGDDARVVAAGEVEAGQEHEGPLGEGGVAQPLWGEIRDVHRTDDKGQMEFIGFIGYME